MNIRAFMLIGALLALVLSHHDVFLSMIDIWWRSETFAHGFLIYPIALWLIWRQRSGLRGVISETDYLALPALLFLGMVWLSAEIVDVAVVKQIAVTLMIPVLVWLLYGLAVVRVILFPLLFLLFSVPIGEGLIPTMMDFTAAFTVKALRWSGIPVFWEGTFFTIPSGQWSVVEGCSGVRYLIASVTLGVLYAYLMYRGIWRRLAFIALAIVFPIIANGLRAYMIVMIAHYSDMRLALGVDHFIYGWVFFGLVMFLLFWIGSFWRERDGGEMPPSVGNRLGANPRESGRRMIAGLSAAVVGVAVWPVWADLLQDRAETAGARTLVVPEAAGEWRRSDAPLTDWTPRYVGPSAELQQDYTNGTDQVGVYLAYYAEGNSAGELINSQNVLVIQKHPIWRMPYLKDRDGVGGPVNRVREANLNSLHQNLLVWYWNQVGRKYTTNDYEAKIYEALSRLTGGAADGAAIVIYTTVGEDTDAARRVLGEFLEEMWPGIAASLSTVRDR